MVRVPYRAGRRVTCFTPPVARVLFTVSGLLIVNAVCTSPAANNPDVAAGRAVLAKSNLDLDTGKGAAEGFVKPAGEQYYNVTHTKTLPPYNTLADEAESVLAAIGEAAFASDEQNDDTREFITADSDVLKQGLGNSSHTCEQCSELLGLKYDYRTPFNLTDRPDLVETSEELLLESETSTSATEGAARASTVRALLNAALPESSLLCSGCLLHRAILEHHRHLRRLYSEEQVLAPPIADRNRLTECPQNLRRNYHHEVQNLERFFPDSRNLDFHELGQLISMNPCIPLPALLADASDADSTRGLLGTFRRGSTLNLKKPRRNVLIDIGPNDFYGSPKHLLDSYAPYLHFDEVYLIDVKNVSIPTYYDDLYNISVDTGGVRVGSRDARDVSTKLKNLQIKREDFVVLKLDVDNGTDGPTMEWGFLSDLVASTELSFVDELYIELHFWYPKIGWRHRSHSMRQAFDVFRQLRRCGLPIHSWP